MNFQPDSLIAQDNERANMTIKVKMDKCADFQDVNCLSGVTLTYQNAIVKMEKDKLYINHVDYSDTIQKTPYSFGGIYVKDVTNMFRVVKAFGVKILYDKKRTLYIDLKPFYANKVKKNCSCICEQIEIFIILFIVIRYQYLLHLKVK